MAISAPGACVNWPRGCGAHGERRRDNRAHLPAVRLEVACQPQRLPRAVSALLAPADAKGSGRPMIRDESFREHVRRIADELRELQCLLVANGFFPPGSWTLPQCRVECYRRGLLLDTVRPLRVTLRRGLLP